MKLTASINRFFRESRHVRSAKIASQQPHHVVENNRACIEFRPEALKARDDIAEQAQFSPADIANYGIHGVRPAVADPEGWQIDAKLFLPRGNTVKAIESA